MIFRTSKAAVLFPKKEREYISKTEPEILEKIKTARRGNRYAYDKPQIRAEAFEKYECFLDEFEKEFANQHGIKNALHGCRGELKQNYRAYLREILDTRSIYTEDETNINIRDPDVAKIFKKKEFLYLVNTDKRLLLEYRKLSANGETTNAFKNGVVKNYRGFLYNFCYDYKERYKRENGRAYEADFPDRKRPLTQEEMNALTKRYRNFLNELFAL